MNRHFQTCDADDCPVCADWHREVRAATTPERELTRVQLTYRRSAQPALTEFET